MRAQVRKGEPLLHYFMSYSLRLNVLNRCIVVNKSPSNIHQMRLRGENAAFTEGPMCRWHVLSGKSGFVREVTSWLTNHPGLAEALGKWCESVSGDELDRHGQVKSGLTSARYLVELVESALKDFRGSEELSDVGAFAAGLSVHEHCLADDVFVDTLRGGVLDPERVKQQEVKWCRGLGFLDMEAEGAKAVSLRWTDTDKGDARRLVVKRDQEGLEEI